MMPISQLLKPMSAAMLSLALLVPAFAQNPTPVQVVNAAPSGTCGGAKIDYITPTGVLYTCQSGVWAQITAAGAPPTGAAGGVLSGTYPNPGFSTTNIIVPGGVLTGASVLAVRSYNTASGDVDFLTAPAGKRILVATTGAGFNTSVSTIAYYLQLKAVGGTYYPLVVPATVATLSTAASASLTPSGLILEPGESLSVHTDIAGLNITIGAIQYDATSPLRSVKMYGAASGDNLFYTVPAGKTAVLGTNLTSGLLTSSAIANAIGDAGASKVYTVSAVPSGGSVSAATRINSTQIVTSTKGNVVLEGSLSAGDFISINASALSTQLIWTMALESPM